MKVEACAIFHINAGIKIIPHLSHKKNDYREIFCSWAPGEDDQDGQTVLFLSIAVKSIKSPVVP